MSGSATLETSAPSSTRAPSKTYQMSLRAAATVAMALSRIATKAQVAHEGHSTAFAAVSIGCFFIKA